MLSSVLVEVLFYKIKKFLDSANKNEDRELLIFPTLKNMMIEHLFFHWFQLLIKKLP